VEVLHHLAQWRFAAGSAAEAVRADLAEAAHTCLRTVEELLLLDAADSGGRLARSVHPICFALVAGDLPLARELAAVLAAALAPDESMEGPGTDSAAAVLRTLAPMLSEDLGLATARWRNAMQTVALGAPQRDIDLLRILGALLAGSQSAFEAWTRDRLLEHDAAVAESIANVAPRRAADDLVPREFFPTDLLGVAAIGLLSNAQLRGFHARVDALLDLIA